MVLGSPRLIALYSKSGAISDPRSHSLAVKVPLTLPITFRPRLWRPRWVRCTGTCDGEIESIGLSCFAAITARGPATLSINLEMSVRSIADAGLTFSDAGYPSII